MFSVKVSTTVRLPIALKNVSTGLPLLGVAYGSVSATVAKSDGTTANLVITSPDWAELTTGAFNGSGCYTLLLPTSATDTVGPLVVSVAVAGALDNPLSVIDVVANLESDTTATLATLATASALSTVGTNVTGIKTKTDNLPTDPADESLIEAAIAALSSDVADVQTAVDASASDSETARKALTGDYFLDSATNTLTIYDEDGATPLFVFDTTKEGVPAILGVTKRVAQ